MRLGAFVAERHPLAAADALDAFAAVAGEGVPATEAGIEALRVPFRRELARRLQARPLPAGLPETTPRTSAGTRIELAHAAVLDDCDGFLRRAAIEASLTRDERVEILRGMVLTRATDNRLKTLFTSGEVRYGQTPFQGKGFRSLGQEAVYAAAIRLRRGPAYRGESGQWNGDVIAPVIRDLGVTLAMRRVPETVRMVLNAQMGKVGTAFDGKDLHIGDFDWGILPPAAPLSISTLTIAGMAMAFEREGSGRVALSFIGEGGSSLGEWHEAINLCAARRLPAIFCVENNQLALSTPLVDQSAARVFADKAVGYGIPGLTIDGNEPDAIASAFAWAAERARAGAGPCLIELVSFRMCGHAHHDDMLYLGRDPHPSWDYPQIGTSGYVDRERYQYWAARDPIQSYARRLEAEGLIASSDVDRFKREAEAIVEEQARAVIDAPWPDPADAGRGVFAGEAPRVHIEVLDPKVRLTASAKAPAVRKPDPTYEVDPGPPYDPSGHTFLEAIMFGIRDALAADPRVFVYGEDVDGKYGNAFLLLRPLLEQFPGRIINSPLAEGAVLGVCVGAALAGQRPIGEMQFNDFVATGFNQLVNNAAKIRYRWGGSVPMVVRMPWGGLRRAGPFHSQNTEAWFYRTPGLKIVVPSTPHDARALFASAVADPDPVLYYEHIALYRDPRLKQVLDEAVSPDPIPLGRAALRRAGGDLAIVSYGAYVHVAKRVADTLASDGIEASVLDLRTLVPLDRDALLAVARQCHKVLIVHEDSRTGGVGESLAAIVQEEAFEWLDAPVRIVGALDTPVPYSPPLEDFYLPSEAQIEQAARLLAAY
jgi:2-oxoisovalerate dehydrogenase E1 component